jgi:hypothetical protein
MMLPSRVMVAVPRRFNDKVSAPAADFGAIRAIGPPRQIQFALRLDF